MIKHTLEISQRPARLTIEKRQLVIHPSEGQPERRFACEDVGILILQHPAISLTAAVLNTLLESGAAIIICNQKHLPSGILLPTVTHTELVPRMMAQLSASLPAKKTAWKAIVRAKITAQSAELPSSLQPRMNAIAASVKSGDPENAEARAAKIYWQSRFPAIYLAGDKRDPDGTSLFNSLLNYGYAILRASVARALVSAGLQPALGVFHHHRSNPYCLADDVMEPFRPLVDRLVHRILSENPDSALTELTADHRRELLGILTFPITLEESSGPLMAVLPRYINAFFRLLTKETESLPRLDY